MKKTELSNQEQKKYAEFINILNSKNRDVRLEFCRHIFRKRSKYSDFLDILKKFDKLSLHSKQLFVMKNNNEMFKYIMNKKEVK